MGLYIIVARLCAIAAIKGFASSMPQKSRYKYCKTGHIWTASRAQAQDFSDDWRLCTICM
jgi:hypothetical protein